MQTIADSLLLFSLVYAIYRFSAEGRDRQAALEQDLQNARQLQQVLIPESLPEISGFTLTSAYKPALEVGGDFFQIISLADGSTLIVLGDVSGKGLKAAMAVSLIVGLVRALAPIFSEPGKLLAEVNDRLVGRLHGGFATALALRLDAAGKCALACAGHLPPFLNDRELDLPGALPLGIAAEASYDETALQLNPADCLALYTDGLLEARSVTGELYGFDRLRTLFAADPTADQATEAAVAFGQDDDITVLTLTRLGAGEASTLHHTARLPAM
jgi:serine phosphatase RsbU (regulator of sigma subunit)